MTEPAGGAVRTGARWTLPASATLGEAAQRIEEGARLLFAVRDDGALAGLVHALDVRSPSSASART